MMKSIIVAKGSNNVIGKNNELMWKLSADLQRFKSITMGSSMIMGRKTFESIGKPLPGRKTVIITRQDGYYVEGCTVVSSVEAAFDACLGEDEVFIVGGAEIYNQTIDLVDNLYITQVHYSEEGDAYFPDIDDSRWGIIYQESFEKDEKNQYDYTFIDYLRK